MGDKRVQLRVFVLQGYTPEAGQEAIKKIHSKVEEGNLGGGVIKVEVLGATRHENPFPEWFKEDFESCFADLEYDAFNFLYSKIYGCLADAEEVAKEIGEMITEYLADTDLSEEQKKFLCTLSCSIAEMPDKEVEAEMNTF